MAINDIIIATIDTTTTETLEFQPKVSTKRWSKKDKDHERYILKQTRKEERDGVHAAVYFVHEEVKMLDKRFWTNQAPVQQRKEKEKTKAELAYTETSKQEVMEALKDFFGKLTFREVHATSFNDLYKEVVNTMEDCFDLHLYLDAAEEFISSMKSYASTVYFNAVEATFAYGENVEREWEIQDEIDSLMKQVYQLEAEKAKLRMEGRKFNSQQSKLDSLCF